MPPIDERVIAVLLRVELAALVPALDAIFEATFGEDLSAFERFEALRALLALATFALLVALVVALLVEVALLALACAPRSCNPAVFVGACAVFATPAVAPAVLALVALFGVLKTRFCAVRALDSATLGEFCVDSATFGARFVRGFRFSVRAWDFRTGFCARLCNAESGALTRFRSTNSSALTLAPSAIVAMTEIMILLVFVFAITNPLFKSVAILAQNS